MSSKNLEYKLSKQTNDHLSPFQIKTTSQDQMTEISNLKKEIEIITKDKNELIDKVQDLENQIKNDLEKKSDLKENEFIIELSKKLNVYLKNIEKNTYSNLDIDLKKTIISLSQLFELLKHHKIDYTFVSDFLFQLICLQSITSSELKNDVYIDLKATHIQHIITLAIEMQLNPHQVSFDMNQSQLYNKSYILLREIWPLAKDIIFLNLLKDIFCSVGLQLIIPMIGSSFDVSLHKIYQREKGQSSLIKQQITKVIYPGFFDTKTNQVIEKSNVVILD